MSFLLAFAKVIDQIWNNRKTGDRYTRKIIWQLLPPQRTNCWIERGLRFRRKSKYKTRLTGRRSEWFREKNTRGNARTSPYARVTARGHALRCPHTRL